MAAIDLVYRRVLRPILFRLDPEFVHDLVQFFLARVGPLLPSPRDSDPRLTVQTLGLSFANPIGLAAGLDKYGSALRGLAALGFGHIEAGTVTLRAQPGNPRPRVFRLPQDRGLINRMGFPNAGCEHFRRNLVAGRPKCRLGVNIGKGKDTPLESAPDDYVALFERLHDLADYVAINVSSPNTVGLRQLQAKAHLAELLGRLTTRRGEIGSRCPLLVKIAPDLTDGEIDDVLEAVAQAGIDGIVATNTTLARPDLKSRARAETGGLSGAPLGRRATEVIRYVYRATGGRLPIVGAGGMFDAADVLEKIRAGASLVQIYTGFIYEGPGVVQEIDRGLLITLERDGVASIEELVGVDA